jgi:hypothetical protein
MENILEDLIKHLESIKNSATINHGDLSDLGNEIGIIIGQYTNDEMGYEKDDFVSGVRHGISISDGTHGF